METMDYKVQWGQAKALEIKNFVIEYYKKNGFPNCMENLKIKVSKRRCRSWGGIRYSTPFANVHIGYCDLGRFKEYKSVANSSEIGSVKDANWKQYVTVLLCHEIAHAIQHSIPRFGNYTEYKKFNDKLLKNSNMDLIFDRRHRGHGFDWQIPYCILRREFVNNGVTEPEFVYKEARPKRKQEIESKTVVRYGNTVYIYYYKNKKVAHGYSIFPNRFEVCITNSKNEVTETVTIKSGRQARKAIKEIYNI